MFVTLNNSHYLIASFSGVLTYPVGQETRELKFSTFKAAEQIADSGKNLNRRFPHEHPNEQIERDRTNARKIIRSFSVKRGRPATEIDLLDGSTEVDEALESKAKLSHHNQSGNLWCDNPTYKIVKSTKHEHKNSVGLNTLDATMLNNSVISNYVSSGDVAMTRSLDGALELGKQYFSAEPSMSSIGCVRSGLDSCQLNEYVKNNRKLSEMARLNDRIAPGILLSKDV